MWATKVQWRVPARSREDGCSQKGLVSWLRGLLSRCSSHSVIAVQAPDTPLPPPSLPQPQSNLFRCKKCKLILWCDLTSIPPPHPPKKNKNKTEKHKKKKEALNWGSIIDKCHSIHFSDTHNSPHLKALFPVALTWVDLSWRGTQLGPSGSLGQCPCRYGPMMASRDIVRLMPGLSWWDLAFLAVSFAEIFSYYL